jgi:hypothetical protein
MIKVLPCKIMQKNKATLILCEMEKCNHLNEIICLGGVVGVDNDNDEE